MLPFLRSRWHIARTVPRFWASVGLIIVTGLVLLATPHWSPQWAQSPDFLLRIWAMALQVLGGLVVWKDLSAAAKAHGHPGIVKSTWAALRALARGHRVVHGVASITLTSDIGRVRARQRRTLDRTLSAEQRLDRIEANLGLMDDDLVSLGRELDSRLDQSSRSIQRESAERKASVESVKSELRERAVGNYPQLVFGAWWAVAGTVLGAASPELARFVASLGLAP